MKIGDETALSQADSLSKSDSLLFSERNKLRDESVGIFNALLLILYYVLYRCDMLLILILKVFLE